MSEFTHFESGSVSGFLHRPGAPGTAGLVLTHGAGGNCQAPLLVTVASAFALAGFAVLRYDLPFRQRKRSGPPFPAQAAADREGLRAAVAALRAEAAGQVFVGGQSYGGRQASMLAAEDSSAAEGLLLLSYPLHAPGKPDQLRTAHFANLRGVALFVHGTKDPFGSPGELEQAIAGIPGRTKLSLVENAGHDLRKGGFDVAGLVVRPFLQLIGDRE